jgi:DNA mismatch repair protein MutS
MMQQYLRIKAQYPDVLLFYRMGDFYELFFEDARRAARTARHHADGTRPVGGEPIPMAGVPVQTLDNVPRARRAQGRVGGDLRADRRSGEIQRTGRAAGGAGRHAGHGHGRRAARGTARHAARRPATSGDRFGLAWLELASGRFHALEATGLEALAGRTRAAAARGAARAEDAQCRWRAAGCDRGALERRRGTSIGGSAGAAALRAIRHARPCGLRAREEAARDRGRGLPAAVCPRHAEVRAAPPARHPLRGARRGAAARRRHASQPRARHQPVRPPRQHAGRRARPHRHRHGWPRAAPLDPATAAAPAPREHRLQAIEAFLDTGPAPVAVQALLRQVGDIERILARVALRSARPRDLAGLRDALGLLPELQSVLPASTRRCSSNSPAKPARTRRCTRCCPAAIIATPPALLRDGGVIAPGYDADLDELRRISEHSDEACSSSRRANGSAPASRTCASATTACRATTSRSAAARQTQVPPTGSGGRPSRTRSATSRPSSSRSRTACWAPAIARSPASASSTTACSTG